MDGGTPLVSLLKADTQYVVLLHSGALCILGLDLAMVQVCSIVDNFQPFFSGLDGLDAIVLVYNSFGTVSKNLLMVWIDGLDANVLVYNSSGNVSKNFLMVWIDGLDANVLVYNIFGTVSKNFLRVWIDGLEANVLVYNNSGTVSKNFLKVWIDGLDANEVVYNNVGTVSKNILMVLMPMYWFATILVAAPVLLEVMAHHGDRWNGLNSMLVMFGQVC